VRAVATGSAGRDVSAGAAPRAVELPVQAAGVDPTLPAGIPICYELLFPDLVRRFVDDGAGVLLGITNDAWYGRTGAPLQFLAITALRSAETGVWTARAANTGVSAFIDPRGRVRERTDVFERDLLVRQVPVRPPGERATFYVRHGDAFARACWAGTVLLGAAAAWARRRSGGRDE
jgi:apolipoprotein N-acyltransferase